MEIINRPSIVLDEEDQQVIENFENLATTLDDELCTKVDCENCPCHIECSQLFNLRPFTEINKIINFFRNLSIEEG